MKVKCKQTARLFYTKGEIYEVSRQYTANAGKNKGKHFTEIFIKHGLVKQVETEKINNGESDFEWEVQDES